MTQAYSTCSDQAQAAMLVLAHLQKCQVLVHARQLSIAEVCAIAQCYLLERPLVDQRFDEGLLCHPLRNYKFDASILFVATVR